MKKQDFEKLLKKDLYQVFFFTCPAHMPVSFARHPWFVCNRMGKVDRYEVIFTRNKCRTSWGHLHKNVLQPSNGIEVFTFGKMLRWPSRLEKRIEGKKGSLADRMADFICSSEKKYKFCDTYSLLGPNSNTYAQWVLDKFPEFEAKLSWNAIGKGYLKRRN